MLRQEGTSTCQKPRPEPLKVYLAVNALTIVGSWKGARGIVVWLRIVKENYYGTEEPLKEEFWNGIMTSFRLTASHGGLAQDVQGQDTRTIQILLDPRSVK
jgi:hypothetical protein